MPQFVHRRVKENDLWVLTVIQLEPEIVTTLSEHSLAQPPEYHAISYAWTHEALTSRIVCNGKDLAVTPDVLECLRCLSTINGCQDLWIDAICIDQEDKEEKAHQVANMHEVYKNAVHVQVWLGPAENKSDLAMDTIKTISDKFEDVHISRIAARQEIMSFGHNLLMSNPSIPLALWHLYSRSWFRRL